MICSCCSIFFLLTSQFNNYCARNKKYLPVDSTPISCKDNRKSPDRNRSVLRAYPLASRSLLDFPQPGGTAAECAMR